MTLFPVLIFCVIVQQLRWSQDSRGLRCRVVLSSDIGVEDCLVIWGERFLVGFVLTGDQIDGKSISIHQHIAPGMTVSLGKLGSEWLHAGIPHGDDLLAFTLLESDLPIEGTLKQRLEVD